MSKIDFEYKKLHPFKWYILENFPFLEDSIDALTNYELLCKLGKEINKNRDSINTLGTSTEDLITAYNNLYDYVNNYFNNLDVQEEVNNKLDSMVTDGTLDRIINQEIFGDIQNDIEELESNVEELNSKIDYFNLNPVELLFDSNVEKNIQGGCTDGDFLYVYCLTSSTSGQLRKYNVKTRTLIGTFDNVPLYHGNGMAIVNDIIYSADFYDGSEAFSKKISTYNLNTGVSSQINPFSSENISRCYGIAKFDDNNILVGCSASSDRLISNSKIYKLNINTLAYEEIGMNINDFPNYNYYGDSLLCDIEFKNNKLVILTSYPGQVFVFDYVNNIFKLEKIYNIDSFDENGISYCEFEGIEKYNDDKNTFIFHTANENNLQVYLFSLDSNLSSMEQPLCNRENNQKTDVFLKKSSTALYENGTEAFPFKTLANACSCLMHNKNIIGAQVRIIDSETYPIYKGIHNFNGIIVATNQNPRISFGNASPFLNSKVEFFSNGNNRIALTNISSLDYIYVENTELIFTNVELKCHLVLSRSSKLWARNSIGTLENNEATLVELQNSSFANLAFTSITGYSNYPINNHGNSICYINSYINSLNPRTTNDSFLYAGT